MGARGVLRFGANGHLFFHCPGCDERHGIAIGEGVGPRWGWNGDYDQPTFKPSINVTWSEPSDDPAEIDDMTKDKRFICHSFVTDGQIQFLGDCAHALAGKTVRLEPCVEEA